MSTLDLINAVESGDAVATEAAFNAAMSIKVAEKLETMRTDIAKNMFAQVQEQEVTTEE